MTTKMDFELKKVTTPEFRTAFVNVFTPKAFQGQEPKYSLVLLFSKKTDISSLKKAADNAAIEKWGKDKTKWPKFKNPTFKDGDTQQHLLGYPGMIYLTASAKLNKQPGVVGPKRIGEFFPELDANDFYAGCYARATLVAFAYDTGGNRGVGFALLNVQKLRDGERFSGRRTADQDFDEVDDGEGADDPTNYGAANADEESESTEDMGF